MKDLRRRIVYLDGVYWGVYEMREKTDDHDFTDYYYDQDKNNIQYLKTWGAVDRIWSQMHGLTGTILLTLSITIL